MVKEVVQDVVDGESRVGNLLEHICGRQPGSGPFFSVLHPGNRRLQDLLHLDRSFIKRGQARKNKHFSRTERNLGSGSAVEGRQSLQRRVDPSVTDGLVAGSRLDDVEDGKDKLVLERNLAVRQYKVDNRVNVLVGFSQSKQTRSYQRGERSRASISRT